MGSRAPFGGGGDTGGRGGGYSARRSRRCANQASQGQPSTVGGPLRRSAEPIPTHEYHLAGATCNSEHHTVGTTVRAVYAFRSSWECRCCNLCCCAIAR